jgi:hypothetical protein
MLVHKHNALPSHRQRTLQHQEPQNAVEFQSSSERSYALTSNIIVCLHSRCSRSVHKSLGGQRAGTFEVKELQRLILHQRARDRRRARHGFPLSDLEAVRASVDQNSCTAWGNVNPHAAQRASMPTHLRA